MNASFSILQKLKNQFLQTVPNKSDYHIAFAPFAFTMSNDDFYFLKNNIQTGTEALKYLQEQAEFAFTSNAILKKPNIWMIDSDNLLYNAYKNILDTAQRIDPDVLTSEENIKIDIARNVLFTEDGNDSPKYEAYKSYAARASTMEKNIIDHNTLKSGIDPADTPALQKWNIDLQNLINQKRELQIEWQVKGFKTTIESAKTTYEAIIFGKSDFIQKWGDAKTFKMASPNLQTDKNGTEFFITSCLPNSICDYQSPIWKKVVLVKADIAQLTTSFTNEIPASILTEFGDLQPELDSISYEYCIIDILRPWFDESIINNRFWKFSDETQVVSAGDDALTGQIPAYPVKIILSKNIDLVFTPHSPVNEDIKNKLKSGNRLFFGPLLLKTIPNNLEDAKINSYRVQQLSNKELSIITKVATQNNGTPAKVNEASKFRMIETMNRKPQQQIKQNVQTKSVGQVRLFQAQNIKSGAPPTAKPRPGFFGQKFGLMSGMFNKMGPQVVRPSNFPRNIEMQPRPPQPQPQAQPQPQPQPQSQPVPEPTPAPQPQSTGPFSITGRIVDGNNLALQVVEIQIMNTGNASTQSVLSLEDGTYRFDDILNGTYQFKVRKTGFLIQEKSIEIKNNSVQDFLLETQPVLTESFQVMGVICKKLPKLPNPLPGAVYI